MSKEKDRPRKGDKTAHDAPVRKSALSEPPSTHDATSRHAHADAEHERLLAEAGTRPAGRGESDEQLGVRGGGNKRGREEIRKILDVRGRGGGHRQ